MFVFIVVGVSIRAQNSLTSADFGLPVKKTFTFYHIKRSSEVLLHFAYFPHVINSLTYKFYIAILSVAD